MFYPAYEKYTTSYVYPWYARRSRWKPRLAGVLYQNNKIGFIFGISSPENDLLEDSNIDKLRQIDETLEKIKKQLRADQKSYAGILPGVMMQKGILSESPEQEVTTRAVVQALNIVREQEALPADTPVALLGGKGFIGRRVCREVEGAFSFDLNDEARFEQFTTDLKSLNGQTGRMILINVTKKKAISDYLKYLWDGVVIINEVYPEPSKEELRSMAEIGVTCYHVVGAKGKAWPAFPRGYAGGIPCCASFWPENGEYHVIVEKMQG